MLEKFESWYEDLMSWEHFQDEQAKRCYIWESELNHSELSE